MYINVNPIFQAMSNHQRQNMQSFFMCIPCKDEYRKMELSAYISKTRYINNEVLNDLQSPKNNILQVISLQHICYQSSNTLPLLEMGCLTRTIGTNVTSQIPNAQLKRSEENWGGMGDYVTEFQGLGVGEGIFSQFIYLFFPGWGD